MPITIPGYVSVCVFMALYWPAAGWVICRLVKVHCWPTFLAVAVVWTGLEHLRGWFIAGFPWFLLGHSQVSHPAVIQIADLVGAYGVTFIIAMVNGLIADLIFQAWSRTWQTRRNLIGGAVTVLAIVGALGYGMFRLGQNTIYPGPKLAVVQEDFPLAVAGQGIDLFESLAAHLAISRRAAEEKPAMIVWPETTVAVPINDEFVRAKVDD